MEGAEAEPPSRRRPAVEDDTEPQRPRRIPGETGLALAAAGVQRRPGCGCVVAGCAAAVELLERAAGKMGELPGQGADAEPTGRRADSETERPEAEERPTSAGACAAPPKSLLACARGDCVVAGCAAAVELLE